MRYILSYDIQSNRRRARVAKVLLGVGDRVQYSVFEANVTEAELRAVLARIVPLLGNDDSFRAYPLCRECLAGVYRLGRNVDDPLVDPGAIII